MGKYTVPSLITAAFVVIAIVALRVNPTLGWLNWLGLAVMLGCAGYAWWRACRPGAS